MKNADHEVCPVHYPGHEERHSILNLDIGSSSSHGKPLCFVLEIRLPPHHVIDEVCTSTPEVPGLWRPPRALDRSLEPDLDPTSAGDVAAKSSFRPIQGLLDVHDVVASRFEGHLAPHSVLEDLLHLVADLSTDSQKALQGYEPRAHDFYRFPPICEAILEDSFVDGAP